MNDLDRSIIATLAYYGAFIWPLTPMEVYERLIPLRRLGGRDIPVTIGGILERLDRLTAMGMIVCESGLYALVGVPNGFGDVRIKQEKIWAQKWRRMLGKARWLQAVPYVRGICASGSLALGNMSAQSDWDIFIVAQAGRLYTARLGLLFVAWLLRALRTKHDASASDKFCFNHYVTTDGLAIRHRSLYVAHGLALLVPVYDSQGYLGRLWQANQWIGGYRSMPTDAGYIRRSVRPSGWLGIIKYTGELALAWMEVPLRAWQKRRIEREPATHQRGGRVVAGDRELEFHPRSFEAVALAYYNAVLKRHGWERFTERDSGLTR
jgi:hypothetical protein